MRWIWEEIIRFVLPLFLSVAFVAKIARGEYRDKWKSYSRFDYAEPYSIFVVTKIMKGECRDVKNGCFSLFYRAVFCLVFIEEKISIIRKTKCSSVLKQNVLFYKTKRTYVNLFSYPNWHKKAPKKYAFFGAFLFGHITPKTRTNI